MAIGVIFHFQDATNEQYDEVTRALNNEQPMRSLADWSGGGISLARGGRNAGRAPRDRRLGVT